MPILREISMTPGYHTHSVEGAQTCAQRNAEGGGFLLSGFARFDFGYCTVIFLESKTNKNKIHNKTVQVTGRY